MVQSRNLPPWWNRTLDDSGRRIRTDVVNAATSVWGAVCREVKRILGADDEAAVMLEKAVSAVSAYLDRHRAAPQDPSGLLIVAVSRLAQREARRRNCTQNIGNTSDFDLLLHAPDWTETIDRRLFLQTLVRHLRPETQGVLRLRLEGFEWNEIGRILNSDASGVRRTFWRDIRNAQLKLLRRSHANEEKE